MLRPILLSLSRDKQLRHWFEHSSFSKPLTSRFIAGSALDDETKVVEQVSAEGFLASVDFLGENVSSEAEACACRDTYLHALGAIRARNLPVTASVKLTQFGLDLSSDLCIRNVRALVQLATELGTRIEIDMESSDYTERTLEIVHLLHREFPGGVRAVIQAYLHRSENDVRELSELGIPIRLCKGAYREPPSVAIQDKPGVDANYRKLMLYLLRSGTYPAIASHDETIVREAADFARQQAIAPDKFEFQMLYGIRRNLQRELIRDGFRLRLYIPYGDAWYPYFMRRLAERPANMFFLVKNLFRS